MLLYVNGDSHSAGHDAGGPAFSYGKNLADHLNMNFVCDAVSGCSNDTIITRTKNFLENNCPDLIVIGWSTWERETWKYKGTLYNITSSGTDTVHPDLIEKYKQWVIDSCSSEFQQRKEEENQEKIWNLHNHLKEKNIKHLFFNCYSHFLYTRAFNKKEYDWGTNYLAPYEKYSTYYFWLEQKGFKPANPKYYHYGPDAHKAWADYLLPYIKKL
jgi:hypothetical protein